MVSIKHDPYLFTTVHYKPGDNTVRTVYGFIVEDGEIKLHFVERFSKKSSRAKTWTAEDVYHSLFMSRQPDDLVIPDSVIKAARTHLTGFIVTAVSDGEGR